MSKWQMTDAAEKRIQERVIASLQKDDMGLFRPWDILLEAMEPEDFARPRDSAEELVKKWMRAGDMRAFCTQCFGDYCRQRRELREAGERIYLGIRTFGREFGGDDG